MNRASCVNVAINAIKSDQISFGSASVAMMEIQTDLQITFTPSEQYEILSHAALSPPPRQKAKILPFPAKTKH